MTKTLRRSMKCLPATIQNQMHNFGKGTIATNRSKKRLQSKLTPLHYQEGHSKSQGGDQRLKVRIGQEKFKWSSLKMVILSQDQAKPSNLQQRRSTIWQKVSKKMKLPPKNTPSNKLHH